MVRKAIYTQKVTKKAARDEIISLEHLSQTYFVVDQKGDNVDGSSYEQELSK